MTFYDPLTYGYSGDYIAGDTYERRLLYTAEAVKNILIAAPKGTKIEIEKHIDGSTLSTIATIKTTVDV